MKKLSVLLLAFLLFPCLVLPVFAHPGSLDAYGGHWNHSTGEYHYHEGTNTSSGSDQSNSSYSYNYTDYQEGYADGKASGYDDGYDKGYMAGSSAGRARGKEEGYQAGYADAQKAVKEEYTLKLQESGNKSKGKIPWWWLVVVCSIGSFYILFKNQELEDARKRSTYCKEELDVRNAEVKSLQAKIADQQKRFDQKIVQEKKRLEIESGTRFWDFHCELKKIYGDRYMYDMAGAPPDAYLDKNYLPHTRKTDGYWVPDQYTFYLGTSAGSYRKFHKSTCKYANHALPINAYHIRNSYGLERCKVCYPRIPSTAWVDKLKELYQFIDKYEKPIELEPEPLPRPCIMYSLREKND